LNTAHDGRELRSELDEGLDVCGKTRYSHEDLRECVQNSVHIAALARKRSVAAYRIRASAAERAHRMSPGTHLSQRRPSRNTLEAVVSQARRRSARSGSRMR
jgi:hypothetical protein